MSITLCENNTTCSITTGNYSSEYDFFRNKNIFFGDSVSTLTFRCDESLCSGSSIYCPTNGGECNIICDAPQDNVCDGIKIYAQKSKSVSFSCHKHNGCQHMVMYGPDDTVTDSSVSINCTETASCQSGNWSLSDVDAVSINCDARVITGVLPGGCQWSKYYLKNSKSVNVYCAGGFNCAYTEYHADNAGAFDITCDSSNTSVGIVWGCKFADIDCMKDGTAVSIELLNDDGYSCGNDGITPQTTSAGTVGSSGASRIHSLFVWMIILAMLIVV